MKLSLFLFICFIICLNEFGIAMVSNKNRKIYKNHESPLIEGSFKWNNKTYSFTEKCINDCHKRGLCLDDKCFCDDGYVGKHCERIRHKEVKQYYFLSEWILWIIISSVGVSMVTLGILFSCNK